MTFQDLIELRRTFQAVTFDEWLKFWLNHAGCDAQYAQSKWVNFSDSPLLWMTSHSWGQEFFIYITELKEAKK